MDTLVNVAGQPIEAVVTLGQYFGEIEHVSVSCAVRPRNNGFRRLMRQFPERQRHWIRIGINFEHYRDLIRFLNHSCDPFAQFLEASNGSTTTIVAGHRLDHPDRRSDIG